MSLDQPEDRVQVTYVWLDHGDVTKAKCRTLNFIPETVDQVPDWACAPAVVLPDGSIITKEYLLKPVQLYRDPFRRGNNKIVLCQAFEFNDGGPAANNKRYSCQQVMDQVAADHDPWFGIEQEYCLMDATSHGGSWPLGWPKDGFPDNSNLTRYVFGVGTGNVVRRDISEAHYRACLFAGIPIAGVNPEGVLGQWEFQVGPSPGVECGDHLWMARHMLRRVTEDAGIIVSFEPRIVAGWIGSGGHTNYSTKQSRDKQTGMQAINDMIHKLSLKHEEHLRVYDLSDGRDNKNRLKSSPVNSDYDQFTSGIGVRNVSVRIPQLCAQAACGYIEDRRPAANADPYVVTEMIVRTTLLPDQQTNEKA